MYTISLRARQHWFFKHQIIWMSGVFTYYTRVRIKK